MSSPRTSSPNPPTFCVVAGDVVHDILRTDHAQIIPLIKRAYRALGTGEAVNPDSYFLRFPEKPNERIIALPGYLGCDFGIAGLKWISSFPANTERDLPRASAVLILNDYHTGYPFACMECSLISAARTAAFAVLAAQHLNDGVKRAPSLGLVGNGVIARTIAEFFFAEGWTFDRIYLYSLSHSDTAAMARTLRSSSSADVLTAASCAEVIRASSILTFATTAATPYITDPELFAHHPLVLNVSLRDLSPEVVLSSLNIVDDVEHCLKANTSPHLAEQMVGHRDFLHGTLEDVLSGRCELPSDRTRIFSPFGLGILDLALGMHVYRRALAANRTLPVPHFFHALTRW